MTSRTRRSLTALVVLLHALSACSGDSSEASSGDDPQADVVPEYTADGELVRPERWDEWNFVGSALNLNYLDTPLPTDVISTVYIEPTAYDHFRETGEFREGTMTVLAAYATRTGAPPAEGGLYPTDLLAFEMSVKDQARHAAGWAYMSFGDALSAPANPAAACFDCHDEHAETDHVFTQFYPRLP